MISFTQNHGQKHTDDADRTAAHSCAHPQGRRDFSRNRMHGPQQTGHQQRRRGRQNGQPDAGKRIREVDAVWAMAESNLVSLKKTADFGTGDGSDGYGDNI